MVTFISSFNKYFNKHVFLNKNFTKKHVLFIFVGVIFIFGFYWYFATDSKRNPVDSVVVVRGAVQQYVKVTGAVEPAKDAALSFQSSGQVTSINVKIGDTFEKGRVLAALSSADAQVGILQAEANLESERSLYDQLSNGARPEEIALKEQAFENATYALNQVYSTLPDSIRAIEGTSLTVVKNKFSTLFAINGDSYRLSFSSCDQKAQSVVENKRAALETVLAQYSVNVSTITSISSNETIEKTFLEGNQVLVQVNDFVTSVSNLLLASCSLGNASLDAYRATLSSSRVDLQALFSSVSVAKTSLISSKNVYNQAKRDLDLVKAGTDVNKLRAQSARVKQSEAQLAQAQAVLEKTKIIAPFSGTVSDISVSVGESVTLGKPVMSILTANMYQVEASIPEIDIVKIKLGGKVSITLDAYGSSQVFPATVTRINPTATMQGNVPVYKVLVTFLVADERVRGGMTANLVIATEEKKDTLIIPVRYVKLYDASRGSVLVAKGKSSVEREVLFGTRGENGIVEVISGLQEGDVVLARDLGERSSQKETE